MEDKLEREYKFYMLKKKPDQQNPHMNEMMLKEATDMILDKFRKLNPKYEKIISHV